MFYTDTVKYLMGKKFFYNTYLNNVEKGSKKPGNQSKVIQVKGHKQITQIQVSPSSTRHGGAYYKISTSDRGIVKVVDKKTYKPTPDEKATIIYK